MTDSPPLKVLFCALGIYSSPGGIQRFDQRVIRCLSELRPNRVSDVTLLVLWDRAENSERVHSGIRFLPCSRGKLRMLIRFLWLTWTEKPEVIFLDHVLLTPLAALGAILAPKARRYLFVYGDEVWKPASWARALLVGGLIQKVVAISQFTIARMRNSYGLSEDRFALLPCALDVGDGSSIRTTRDFKMTGLHRLLTVSRLDPREIDKGHSKVILALPSILAAFPDTHYYVVGEGPLQEKLRSLAEQTGVAAHVHFVGRVDDPGLEELYAGSHLFVMPSKKEGFGIVYLEAWRHGLPVIAGNKDASAEVIEHNVTGLLVDPDSEEEISRAIITLLSDGAARARMGQAGYATLAKKYSHAIFKERLDHILTQC